ncbi:tetratricopeptide repeat protein [Nannocystis pusilla]|uniref:tetratricopeptide repeat protein n=1 Tax=Nannocystis pusilla TaxID=889268 RepID=UPI003B7DDF46
MVARALRRVRGAHRAQRRRLRRPPRRRQPGHRARRQWFGTALWARQEFDRAKAVLPDSRARLERAFGPEHPEVAAALRYEGNLYFVLTDFDAALATWRRGLDIILRTRGEDDPLVVVFQGNIAAALARARRSIDAVAAFEAVVRSLERRHGPDHIELCTQLDNLAASYLEAGQLDPARAVIDRSLAIRRRVLGEDHAEVARSLLGLGEWGLHARDYATAIPAFERALAIRAGTDVHTLCAAAPSTAWPARCGCPSATASAPARSSSKPSPPSPPWDPPARSTSPRPPRGATRT